VISSGDGADTITVTSGNNTINAGGGANTIVATSGINVINTGGGADTITTGGVAGGGNTINAGDGANTITTGAGDDTITGGNGADTITTGAGNDVVHAGDGANTVTTGAGNDIVYSGVDTDTITTGAGDDEIHIKGGTDTIAAGAGNDTLIADFSAATGAVSINTLAGNVDAGYAGNISGLGIATFAGVENFEITSGGFDDVITTGDGTDVVHAGGGSDIVNLAGGDDEAIYTMGANVGASDVYKGGDGVDTLTLEFTEAEWSDEEVQSEIARYQEHLIDDSADTFIFGSSLEVSEFEHLSVRIGDGDAVDMTVAPVDDVPDENYSLNWNDNYTIQGSGDGSTTYGPFTFTGSGSHYSSSWGLNARNYGGTGDDADSEAFNGWAADIGIQLTSGDEFDFLSASLADGYSSSTPEQADADTVTMNGYNDGDLIYSETITLADQHEVEDFNFTGIDKLEMLPGTNGWYSIDDMSFFI
jgi:hypothetical protein